MPSNNNPRISIIIPVYNSESSIGPLVTRLVDELGSSFATEIILRK